MTGGMRMWLRWPTLVLLAGLVAGTLGGAASSRAATTSDTFTGTVSAGGAVSKTFTIDVTDLTVPIQASLDWTTTSANLNLFLSAPDSTAPVAQSVSKTARPESLTLAPTVPGTYKLRVKAVSGSSDFTLSASWGGGGAGTINNPTQVFTGSVSTSGTVAERHRFQVDDISQPIEASLDWTTTSANLNLYLTGPGSSTILAKAATQIALSGSPTCRLKPARTRSG